MNKKIITLLIIILALGGVVLVFDNPFQAQFRQAENKLFFPNLKIENLAAIEISYFTQGVRLEKTPGAQGLDGPWMVKNMPTDLTKKIESQSDNDSKSQVTRDNLRSTDDGVPYEADPDKVQALLEQLVSLQHGAPSTSDPAKQEGFDLSETRAHQILLRDKDDKEMAKIFVGKQGPDPFSTFVRLPDNNDIYLIDDYLPRYFSFPTEEWRKKVPPPSDSLPDAEQE